MVLKIGEGDIAELHKSVEPFTRGDGRSCFPLSSETLFYGRMKHEIQLHKWIRSEQEGVERMVSETGYAYVIGYCRTLKPSEV